MMRYFLLFLMLAIPAKAQQVIAGLSQNRIAITANFDGSEILIFGAVKRDAPVPDNDELQVIVAVAGPSKPITVRRKERRFGIWVNVDAVEVSSAPSFYSIATTAPLSEVISADEDERYDVSITRAISAVPVQSSGLDAQNFTRALIRIRSSSGLYQVNPGSVTLEEDTLFRTSISLPSNLTEGVYSARIFLTRSGNVVDVFETQIDVQKVGLGRWLFALANERPLIYGLLSLFIAIAAGWTASAVFRYLRP